MSTATARRATAGDYLELVREFPLRPLKNKVEHEAAMRMYAKFAGRERLTSGENDYVDALTHFIGEYEQRAHRGAMFKMTPLEVLKYLMEQNDMRTTDLGYAVGSRGLASEMLNGKRGLSKMIIQKLSVKFSVDPGLFLGE